MSPATATRKVHVGDPMMFHIPMGAWYADPSHIIGYTVGNRKEGTQRDMANNWRCAIVRWVIRRLLV